MSTRFQSGFRTLLALLSLGAFWWLVSSLRLVSARALPAPGDVLARFASDISSDLLMHTLATLQAIGLSIVISLCLGITGAVLLALVPSLYSIARPYLSFFYAVPRIALAPIFIMMLGIGIANRVALGVVMASFAVLLTMHAAFTDVDSDLIRATRSMGASRLSVWRTVIFPSALPHFFTSVNLAISLSILAAIGSEMILSFEGLGWLLRRRGSVMDVEGVFSVLIVVISLALISNRVVDAIKKRKLSWLTI